MHTRLALVVALSIIPFTLADAQPRAPESDRLAAIVGRWQTELEIKASGGSPAMKIAGSEECAWFANLHVVCRNEAKADDTAYSAIRLISYHAPTRRYAMYTVDTAGAALLALGDISGDTWTFTAEASESRSRLMLKFTPTSFTGASELSIRGGSWTPVSSLKATRVEP